MAMSGGVDSSVAAALLLAQGYEVIGLHMKLYQGPEQERRSKSCCALDEALDARNLCERLGIPFYVLDFQKEFHQTVIEYFVKEYLEARTPNPCVRCNQKIKSKFLLEKAEDLDCDLLATGHYAKIQRHPETGILQMIRPADRQKDQTYFLYGIEAAELPRLRFPLADYLKPSVRKIARNLCMASADKPDSQEICFVSNDYRDFLQKTMNSQPQSGDFINTDGVILGKHQGLAYYTIGQRRGLGISASEPYYVIALDKAKNQVVLGKEKEMYSSYVVVNQVNWVSIPPIQQPICALVKLRYSHTGAKASLIPDPSGTITIHLDIPQKAVSPGQAAVFYQDDILLGGGCIESCVPYQIQKTNTQL